jgi:hypothetical protein
VGGAAWFKKNHGGWRRFLNHGEGQHECWMCGEGQHECWMCDEQRIGIGWVSRNNKIDIPDSIDTKYQYETGAGGSNIWRGCVG